MAALVLPLTAVTGSRWQNVAGEAAFRLPDRVGRRQPRSPSPRHAGRVARTAVGQFLGVHPHGGGTDSRHPPGGSRVGASGTVREPAAQPRRPVRGYGPHKIASQVTAHQPYLRGHADATLRCRS